MLIILDQFSFLTIHTFILLNVSERVIKARRQNQRRRSIFLDFVAWKIHGFTTLYKTNIVMELLVLTIILVLFCYKCSKSFAHRDIYVKVVLLTQFVETLAQTYCDGRRVEWVYRNTLK